MTQQKHLILVLFILMLSLVCISDSAAETPRSKLVAAYIFRLAENIQWANQAKIDSYRIHLIDDKGDIADQLKGIPRIKKIHGKQFHVTRSSSIEVPADAHLVFVAREKVAAYPGIFEKAEGRNVLLISDNVANKRLIMINLVDTKTKAVQFELNKANIINQNLGINPDIILLGGTEIDVAKLYREAQVSLRKQEQQIAKQKQLIENQANQIKEQRQRYDALQVASKKQKEEINHQENKLVAQQVEIEKRVVILEQQEANIKEQQDKIVTQESSLEQQAQIISYQKNTLYLLGIIVLLAAILVYTIYISYRRYRKLNIELQRAHDELEYQVSERTVELVEANKALRNSEVYYRSIFENALYGIVMTGPDFKFTEVNNAWCNLIGYTRDELLGKIGIADVTLPDDRQESMKQIERMVNGEVKQFSLEKHYLSKSGKSVDAIAFVKGIYDSDGQYMGNAASILDITEHNLAKEALHKAKGEASLQKERLARLSTIQVAGELATSFAHELNQPLAAIENYALAAQKRLETGAGNGEKLSELLDKIRTQAQRSGDVIANLRKMVKQQETKKTTVDINTLLNETIELAENEIAQCGCRVEVIPVQEITEIEVDKIQIQQVVLNLIRNAIDAISVLDDEEIKLVTIQLNMNKQNEMEVSVIDNGKGVPDSEIEKLFEPFYTTKEAGMGIGLSICQTIIEVHGGKMWYSPSPAGGAIFHFTLPITNKA